MRVVVAQNKAKRGRFSDHFHIAAAGRGIVHHARPVPPPIKFVGRNSGAFWRGICGLFVVNIHPLPCALRDHARASASLYQPAQVAHKRQHDGGDETGEDGGLAGG